MLNKSNKRSLTDAERNHIYINFVLGLEQNGYNDESDIGIKKAKIIVKLFRDTKREASGEIVLKCNKTIVYELHNDFSKRTRIDIIPTPCKNFYGDDNVIDVKDDEVPALIDV
jgi:hypothetical protein